ncbi:MAG: MATE family efflux transporter [Clostridia bacterium]|nr:MATE family efflux transporter [Clostridia bacterium]
MARFEKNLSEGNVVKQLILFSMPVLISNLIQSLYSAVDMLVVGQFAGEIAMSGVNIGGQVSFLITNMVFGLSVGATVLVGQYKGADDRKSMHETIATLFVSLLVAAALITVSMLILTNPLLRLIKTPTESFSEAKIYFIISMLGTIFIFGYNALSAIMRGLGDSRNPLIFVTIACVVNIILDLLFVAGFKMGAQGAALATVISQAISMILCIIYLKRNDFIFDFSLDSFRGATKEKLKLILKIGIPTSVQNVATSASFLFLTALVNSIGVMASAAVGAVGKLNGFAILPGVAMSTSVSAMSAQNIGAGKFDRAKKTMFTGMAISLLISTVIFALVGIFPEECMRIFGKNPEFIANGAEYIKMFKYDYLIAPLVFCFNGLFIGSGHTTVSLTNGILSSILFRIPASFLFGITMKMGLLGVGLGAPVASAAALVFGIIFYLTGRWKKMVIPSAKQ